MKTERRFEIKKESEIPELGIPIRLQIIDGTIEAVILGDINNEIRITKSSTYSDTLKLTVLQRPELKSFYVVKGKLLGLINYESTPYEEEYDAQGCLNELCREHNTTEDKLGLTICTKEIEVFEDKLK